MIVKLLDGTRIKLSVRPEDDFTYNLGIGWQVVDEDGNCLEPKHRDAVCINLDKNGAITKAKAQLAIQRDI